MARLFAISLFFLLDLSFTLQAISAQRASCTSRSTKVVSEKLVKLRNEMARVGQPPARGPPLEAFIITSDDENQSEFIAERDKRLQYLTGFSGRMGYAAVTKNKSALWVPPEDYWLADSEVSCDWSIFKFGDDINPSLTGWLLNELRTGVRVGADPKLVPAALWEIWRRDLEADHVALVESSTNLVDDIWTPDKPQYNFKPLIFLSEELTGASRQKKLEALRNNLSRWECDAMIVTAPEEIGWLMNVRGSDVEYNPFVRSYVILSRGEVNWYLPREQITDAVAREIQKESFVLGIRIRSYDDIWKDLRTYVQTWRRVLIPGPCEYSPGASQSILSAVPASKRFFRQSPIIFQKARKNKREIDGMRAASIRQSAALVDLLATVENEIRQGSNLTEKALLDRLLQMMKNQTDYMGPAIPPVVAFAAHGAIPNYMPSNITDVELDSLNTLVLHSASHFLDGTTSLARTFHFGVPTRTEIEAYTLTLAGLIQLSKQKFPDSTRTTELDIVLRARLWEAGITYKHSSGHGIGVFSSYEEAPVNINRNAKSQTQLLQEGYFLTIGPSYVQPSNFGIRLENVVEVVPTIPQYSDGQTRFLAFQEATLFPFEEKLIEPSLLSSAEVAYINAYHKNVLQEVGAELKRQSRMEAVYWLMEKTREIRPHCSSTNRPVSISFISIVLFSLLGLCL